MLNIEPIGLPIGLILAACLVALPGSGEAAEPHMLGVGSWVCASAKIHDETVKEQRSGASIMALRKRHEESGQCVYIDDDALEDIMAPFVTVLERNDGHAQVTFILEHYRRLAMLHRKFARMQYTGWTDETNLELR
ncbi:MAG: hypothetical protein ACR2RL_08915 [Gammaproteobacteria bacterium]